MMLEDTIKEIATGKELTAQLTKPADDYNYQLKWWNIGGYDRWDSDSASRRYAGYERKGLVGITFGGITAFELKKIKKWLKDQDDKGIKLSNNDRFWNSDCDGYYDNSYCVWFPKKEQREAFDKFLETLGERPYNIRLRFNEEIVKSILRKIKNKNNISYWVICLSEYEERFVFQTSDEKTAKQVLRLTKELMVPEIMILE